MDIDRGISHETGFDFILFSQLNPYDLPETTQFIDSYWILKVQHNIFYKSSGGCNNNNIILRSLLCELITVCIIIHVDMNPNLTYIHQGRRVGGGGGGGCTFGVDKKIVIIISFPSYY